MSTKQVACATNQKHRFRVVRWIKIILQSGTGLRVPDEFVIIYTARDGVIEAYLDDKGELFLPMSDEEVEVEFPSLYAVSHIDTRESRDVPPEEERKIAVEEGSTFEQSKSTLAQSRTCAVPPVWNDLDADGGDEEPEPEWDEVLPENDTTGQEEEDEEDEDDQMDTSDVPVRRAARDTPVFKLAVNASYIFELCGRLDLRLSRRFFEDRESVGYELLDEDGRSLIQSTTRSQQLSFPALGVGIYTLKLANTELLMDSTQLTDFVQFVEPGESNADA